MGFPCNQFLGQEGKCNAEIKKKARELHLVKFPLFSKVEVNGANCHEVYKFLRTHSELKDEKTGNVQEIPWNFSKFLLDRNGNVVGFYPPTIRPLELTNEIKQLLD